MGVKRVSLAACVIVPRRGVLRGRIEPSESLAVDRGAPEPVAIVDRYGHHVGGGTDRDADLNVHVDRDLDVHVDVDRNEDLDVHLDRDVDRNADLVDVDVDEIAGRLSIGRGRCLVRHRNSLVAVAPARFARDRRDRRISASTPLGEGGGG